MFEDKLNLALERANALSEHAPYGGMASVGIYWDPYKVGWVAFADWSNCVKLKSDPEKDPFNAMAGLMQRFRDEKEAIS
jgi:hypothetical protein